MIRSSQGFYVDQETNPIEDLVHEVFQEKADDFNYFSQKLAIEITPASLLQMLHPFVQKRYAISEEYFEQLVKEQPDIGLAINYLKNMIKDLSDKYQLHLENPIEFIMHIYDTMILNVSETDATYILWDTKKTFIHYIHSNFHHLYHDVQDILDKFRKLLGYPYNPMIKNHMIYTFFVHWIDLIDEITDNIGSIKVLVLSQFDQYHARMIKSMVQNKFSDNISFHLYEEKQLNYSTIKKDGYDIILSNFSLP